MIIDGIWWLAIIASVFVVLLMVGLLLAKNKQTEDKSEQNHAIRKLQQKLASKLPEYGFIVNKNHITVKRAGKKIALITLDKAKQTGSRKLGNVLVLNFRSLPNYQTVLKALPTA